MSRKVGWCEQDGAKNAITIPIENSHSNISYYPDPNVDRRIKRKKISIETIATSDLSEGTTGQGANDATYNKDVSLSSFNAGKWSIQHLKKKFQEANIEDLYGRYCLRIQRSLFIWLLSVLIFYAGLLITLFNACLFAETDRARPSLLAINTILGVGGAFSVTNLLLVANKQVFLRFHKYITFGVFICLTVAAIAFTGLSAKEDPHNGLHSMDDVPMVMFIIFVSHSMFPLSRLASIILGMILGVISLFVSALMYKGPVQIVVYKIVANLFIYLCVNFTGLYHKHLTDIAHRQTFLDTRRFIETDLKFSHKRKMQSQLREGLLCQIIPQYLIEDMKDVLGQKLIHESAVDPQQFVDFYAEDKRHPSRPRSTRPMPDEHAMRKILQKLLKKRLRGPANQFYTLIVKKHEDVSILFADIVQFTRLTEQLTPVELIKTLNALFGRFDHIAQKNDCMRIKILGDCYYCVSGLPEPTPDHAKNCVKMGIDMINIIREVRNETGVERLNMRIGIHTGYVLSGVLGLHKWQYDVWSDDVYIANQMEANGKPGHVHITKATLDQLGNTYDVVSGNQNEFLRVNGIQSYFINLKKEKQEEQVLSPPGRTRRQSIVHFVKEWGTEKPFGCIADYMSEKAEEINEQDEINKRLGDCFHLLPSSTAEDRGKWLKSGCKDIKRFSLKFRSVKKEHMYRSSIDPAFHLGVGCCLFIFVCMGIVQGFALITRVVPLLAYYGTGTALFVLLLLLTNPSVDEHGPFRAFRRTSWYILKNIYLKFALTLICLTVVFIGAIFSVGSCAGLEAAHNVTAADHSEQHDASIYIEDAINGVCVFPTYYLYCCMLSFICCSVFLRLNFIIKIFFMFIQYVVYNSLFHSRYSHVFDYYNSLIGGSVVLTVEVRGGIYLLISFITLAVLNRQTEKSLRLAFLWKTKVKEEKLRVLRSDWLNSLLLENILPRHVADHFFKPAANQDLYYQYHDSVCVLFASIPDIKSTGVTGRECLRLLNEVIAAFDQLLMSTDFNLVEKIKTIGSTYMAAVGLKPDSMDSNVEENVILTVKFCLQMMEKLAQINKDSFSENRLRIGINHGPVVAGVVGAQKPQYDILGDTVNVASRMESHGVVGRIQVRRETMEILERNGFSCEYRDRINVKGKQGLLDVYMVRQPALIKRLDSHASSVELSLSPGLSQSITSLHGDGHM